MLHFRQCLTHLLAHMLLPISDSTNLHLISHRFQVVADHLSNLRFRHWGRVPLFNTFVPRTPKLTTTKFGLWKLETSFRYLEPLITGGSRV